MDTHVFQTTTKLFLAEISVRLNQAADIARAASACAAAGSVEKAVEVTMDIDHILYEATALLNAASLINRIAKQS
jgi:hypothetical protein